MAVLRVAFLGVLSVGCAAETPDRSVAPGPCETWSMEPSFLDGHAVREPIEERLTVDADGRPLRREYRYAGAVLAWTEWTWADGVLVEITSDGPPFRVTYTHRTPEASFCDVSEAVTAPDQWRALLVDWLADQPPLSTMTSNTIRTTYIYADSPLRLINVASPGGNDVYSYVGDLVQSAAGVRSYDGGCNRTLWVAPDAVVRTTFQDIDGARQLSGEIAYDQDVRTRAVSWLYDDNGELANAVIDADGDGDTDQIDAYRCAVRF
ncbi:MAG: hypothetical protein ABMB14_15530 [Myxococcota bacterium]